LERVVIKSASDLTPGRESSLAVDTNRPLRSKLHAAGLRPTFGYGYVLAVKSTKNRHPNNSWWGRGRRCGREFYG
jgi:hypothetical protein